MKLDIGNKIRKHRKQAEMTQEQLADRLGVAYQSVSRWENGATYPDLELLPAIATLFSITLDELMGIPDEKKENQAETVFDNLRHECMKQDSYNAEHIVELLRDIRRNYIDSRHTWRLWCEGNERVFRDPRILPEVRLIAEAYLEKKPMDEVLISSMAVIEDEEHVREFLKKHTFQYDCSERKLLFNRYFRLRDYDKFEPERHYQFFTAVSTLLDRRCSIGWSSDCDSIAAMNDFGRSLLALVRSGSSDTEPDIWVNDRIEFGIERVKLLVLDEKFNEAIEVLRVTVELIEETMKITDKVTWPTSCRFLEGMEVSAEEYWFAPHNDPAEPLERSVYISTEMYDMCVCSIVTPSESYYALCGGDFDALRDDPRFAGLCKRIKAMIVTKPQEKE